jgi:hypothetical protein
MGNKFIWPLVVIICSIIVALGIYFGLRENTLRTMLRNDTETSSSGYNKSRYQYTGVKESHSQISLKDPNTGKEICEYVPIQRYEVFDTWTGKLYTRDDLNPEIIIEEDFINTEVKVHFFPKGALELSPDIDWGKLSKEINIRLERERQKQREDLLKYLLDQQHR